MCSHDDDCTSGLGKKSKTESDDTDGLSAARGDGTSVTSGVTSRAVALTGLSMAPSTSSAWCHSRLPLPALVLAFSLAFRLLSHDVLRMAEES